MNSRERTTRAVEFGNPDRIPLFPEVLSSAWLTHNHGLEEYLNSLPLDCPPCQQKSREEMRQGGKDRAVEDSWGCLWKRQHIGEFGTRYRVAPSSDEQMRAAPATRR